MTEAELAQYRRDGFIVFPFACEGTTAEQTLIALGKDVWPRVNS